MARIGLGSQLPQVSRPSDRCINFHKAERGIKRSVPGQVAVGGQCDTAEALRSGVIRRYRDQCGANPSSLVRPGDRHFRDVKPFVQHVGGEKGDRFIGIVNGHPDRIRATHCLQQVWFQRIPVRDPGEPDFPEKGCGGTLDMGQFRQLLKASAANKQRQDPPRAGCTKGMNTP